jgi:uncharacterized membrane protein YdjX (TVP38/TMEM64 family)
VSRWKISAGVAFVIGLLAAVRLLPVEEWLRAIQEHIDGMGAAGALLYGAVYVAGALLFVPGSLLTIGAGLLFGLVWGTVLVSAASTAASALAFLIGRHLVRERVEKLARTNRRYGALDRAIGQKGWKVVALLRLSPLVPYSLSNYLYGATPVEFGPYLLASWAGALPGTLLYVAIGAAGRAAAAGRSAGEWALIAAGLLATAVVTVMLARAARRNLREAGA